MSFQLNNVAEAILMMLGILTLVMTSLVLYLITLLARVEQTLWQVQRLLRPEVPRDNDGKPLFQRS